MPFPLRLLVTLAICFVPWFGARAGVPMGMPAPACGAAVTEAGQLYHLPDHLLQAIARVESGRLDPATGRLDPWPWTINAAGQGAFFPTKADAIAAVRALQARGIRSIDVGCLQINLMYHPNAFASLEQAFDPQANARYAARFLAALHDDSGDWMNAIASYHSQTLAIGADYRRRVLAFWRNPGADWHLGLAAAYRDFLPRSRVYGDFAPVSSVYGAFAPAQP